MTSNTLTVPLSEVEPIELRRKSVGDYPEDLNTLPNGLLIEIPAPASYNFTLLAFEKKASKLHSKVYTPPKHRVNHRLSIPPSPTYVNSNGKKVKRKKKFTRECNLFQQMWGYEGNDQNLMNQVKRKKEKSSMSFSYLLETLQKKMFTKNPSDELF